MWLIAGLKLCCKVYYLSKTKNTIHTLTLLIKIKPIDSVNKWVTVHIVHAVHKKLPF